MSEFWQSCEERILELLADRAAFGLNTDGQQELRELMFMMPDFDHGCMERTAATVHLASVGKELEPLSASLQQRIRVRGERSHGFSYHLCRDLYYPEEWPSRFAL